MDSSLQRENSVNQQKELLDGVRYNSYSNIEDTLRKYPHLINKIITDYGKTILHIVCFDWADTAKEKTLNILFDYGADADGYYGDEKYNALHYAVLGQNPSVLKIVLQNVQDINALDDYQNNALLLLLKDGDKEKDITECARLLIQADINVNTVNSKNQTCIYFAAKNKHEDVAKLLLDIPSIDLDNYTDFKKKTARMYLTELGLNVDNIQSMDRDFDVQLNQFLIDKDEDAFIREHKASNSSVNYLAAAVQRNLPAAVGYLLTAGNNPNIIEHEKPLIILAGTLGYHEIFKLLVTHPNIKIPDNILNEILMYIDLDPIEQKGIDRSMCLNYLFKYASTINVNFKDRKGNYPLHYATCDISKLLLQRGASLANRDKFNVLTVSEMDYETLKDHFDSCITLRPNDESVKENLTIVFDYNCLLPTKETRFDEEVGKIDAQKYVKEVDVILQMSESSELRNLLLHPLISSFLFMKWQRISFIFYINLLFYLLFCSSFMLYVYDGTRSFLGIMTALLFIREFFQVVVAFSKYYKNFENYIEISLISALIVLLSSSEPSEELRKQLIGIITILAAFELLFLLGNLPSLTTHIVMLRRVSYSFFKIFSFYFIIIMAFAFSFYTLFKDKNEDNDFESYSKAIFKTAIMLTGELEAGDIEFDKHPYTAHLLFMVFVFCIVIILLNLVNGLAVSDTQEIRNEAKLISLIARTEYVSYAEDILFSIQIPSWVVKYYDSMCVGCSNNRRPKDSSIVLGSHVCLFPNYLFDNQLEVYPNQNGRVKFIARKEQTCRYVRLDISTVRCARKLIQNRKEKDKEHKELFDIMRNIIQNELTDVRNQNHAN